jgi:hypothetical protein
LVDEKAGASLSCRSLEQLRAGPPPASVLLEDGFAIYGVVIDGVDRVTVAFGDGQTTSARVQDNAYLIHADVQSNPVSLSYGTAGGPVRHPVVVPRPSKVMDAESSR